MSFNFSPKIVTSGLIHYFDAANVNSYVSGSTTWYDISKKNVNGAINGPIYTSEYGGGLVFDGINDYVLIGTDQNYYFNLTNPYTVSIWFKPKVLTTAGLISRYNAGVRGNYFLKLLYTGNIMYNREISPFNLFSSQVLLVNKPYNVSIVYDGTYQKIYINGVFNNQQASGNIVQNQSNINLYIGCSQSYGNPNEFFNGTRGRK